MATFYSSSAAGFFDDSLHSSIPADAVKISAATYHALLAGQTAGKTIAAGAGGAPILIDPPPPVPAVPEAVTRFQARAALLQTGLLDAVEAAVAAAEDPLIAIAWADTTVWPRTSPTIAALAAAVGISDAEIDQLFITAAQISA